jgi:transcriptional regulator with XRE-family HTH domain
VTTIDKMNDEARADNSLLIEKIARLVQERGWNQEDFARIAQLNRQTVRQILHLDTTRKLRNATVSSCARALGLTVHELRQWPLDRLLPRMRSTSGGETDAQLRRLYERATQPELRAWLERNPERGLKLTDEEADELFSVQNTGGPLTSVGVEQHVCMIERKRRLIEKVHAIAGTELVDVLEKLVELMYEKVQPYRDRV